MSNDRSSSAPTSSATTSPATEAPYVTEYRDGFTLTSPSGELAIDVSIVVSGGDTVVGSDGDAVARYAVSFGGQPVIEPSRLGLSLADDRWDATAALEVAASHATHVETEWEPVWGEWSTIQDVYNELVVELRGAAGSIPGIDLVFRAYDEGVAFRYRLPAGKPSTVDIAAEHTTFVVPDGTTCYGSWQESEYQSIDPADPHLLGPNGDPVERVEVPVTLRTPDGVWASIVEANVDDYPRTTLTALDETAESGEVDNIDGTAGLVTDIAYPIHVREDRDHRPAAVKATDTEHVRVDLPFATPWRGVLVGPSLADLPRNDYMVQNLNEPCRIDDPSWIAPGKGLVARTTTTAGAKAYVDRAAELGFEWLIWDGPQAYYDADQWDPGADATTARDGFDVPEIVAYADRHGVRLMFYIQHFYVERNREAILDQFAAWGVHGIKIGFVNTGPQAWTNWHRETIRMAAEREIHVDVHDQHRPDGFSRTYPNLIAVEGGRGDEWTHSYPPNEDSVWGRPMAVHHVELPVTRFLLGPFDYTYNYMPDGDLRLAAKHAHKLAQSVVYFHPYTDFFRRDRGGRLVSMDDPMDRLTGLRFWRHLPTTWDDTRVLELRMSHVASFARRSGEEWFVGTINGAEPIELELALDFLDPGRRYEAAIYEHDPDAETIDEVRERRRTVTSEDVLAVSLVPESGQAVRLVPL